MTTPPVFARVAALEKMFGDPFASDNALGFDAVLDADDRADTFKAAEDALTAFGMNAELVPTALGGRFSRLDDLIRMGRAVSRRDPALTTGYLSSSLLAAACVWLSGTEEQRRHTARELLDGHRLACAYQELDHGNDFAAECSAQRDGDRLILNGRREAVANASRARALVLFAPTGEPRTAEAHTPLLLRHQDLAGDGVTRLPRSGTLGLRGIHLSGIEFASAEVDTSRVLGGLGRGAEDAAAAFQLTGIALPAMMTSALDTALRCTVRHVQARTLYGRPAIEMGHLRTRLVDVFVTLTAADAYAMTGARSLHLHPDQGPLHSFAVHYVLPTMLMDAMNQLATVLGAHSYLAQGPTALFQKLLRDMRTLNVVHTSRAACRTNLLPQLPRLARHYRHTAADPGHDSLFDPEAELPPLDFSALRATGSGRDHVFGGLRNAAAAQPEDLGPEADRIRSLTQVLALEAEQVQEAGAELAGSQLGPDASPATARLLDRYVRLSLAGCCLQTWRHAGNAPSAAPWMSAWASAVLTRTARPSTARFPEPVEERLFTELLDRCAADRDLGLSGHPLFGT